MSLMLNGKKRLTDMTLEGVTFADMTLAASLRVADMTLAIPLRVAHTLSLVKKMKSLPQLALTTIIHS